MDLIEVFRKPEGKTLEYKRDLSSPDGLLKTLIAFANTAGGTLVIGIEDGTKRVIGVPDVLAAGERLASIIADSIRPCSASPLADAVWQLEEEKFVGILSFRSADWLPVHRSKAKSWCSEP